jgi:hypothetical protein
MLIYLSIMTLVFSCVVIGYSLFFFGLGPQSDLSGVSILPVTIVAVGLVIAAINAIASNILSDQLGKKLETLSPALRVGIPFTAFLLTLALSILIAFLST